MSRYRGHLIMVRHGESVWNRRNQFTGWVDVPLSPTGIEEAKQVGRRIREIPIDVIFVSTLVRAMMTALLAMNEHNPDKVPVVIHEGEKELEERTRVYNPAAEAELIPIYKSSCLNERYYGELQGLNKDETREKYGVDQVQIWRRSFDVPPPKGESLKMTAERTLPFFKSNVVPMLEAGKNVLIAAHGNSLRSIVMELDNLSPEEVVALELGTGVPLFYKFEEGKFHKIDEVKA